MCDSRDTKRAQAQGATLILVLLLPSLRNRTKGPNNEVSINFSSDEVDRESGPCSKLHGIIVIDLSWRQTRQKMFAISR